MIQPDLDHVPPFYKGYVDCVKHMDLYEALEKSSTEALALVSTIAEDKGEYRYQPDKWSIKEVLCHVIDAERIFAYRALRFARQDKTNLHKFEENDYAPRANAHARSLSAIAGELSRLRASTLDLYKSFTPAMLAYTGSANNTEVSVLNLGFIIAGHEAHHCSILQQRYLS
ncbi:MAG: DinB family protein [Bacteroidia bacterium]|nr:DinB family protein [Bacteroidia bacterium]